MNCEECAECIQLYMDGAKLRQLTERYDRHRIVIGRLIRGAGVKRGHKFREKGIRSGWETSRFNKSKCQGNLDA